MSYIGTTEIGLIFLGTTEIDKVYLGSNLVYESTPEEYIVFADPTCEQICANAWGDGVGLKPSRAAAVTSIGTTFSNTAVVSFDEFGEYFISVTSLSASAFNNCTSLQSIVVPSNVTSFGSPVFGNCTALKNLDIRSTSTIALQNLMTGGNNTTIGDGTGVLHIAGNIGSSTRNNYNLKFKKIVVDGNINLSMSQRYPFNANTAKIIKIGGNYTHNYYMTTANSDFIEFGGQLSSSISSIMLGQNHRSTILHFGYNGIAVAFNKLANNVANFNTYFSAVYVGDGSSSASDQAVLNAYLANSSWAQVSSKLHTWYSYINGNPNPDYL